MNDPDTYRLLDSGNGRKLEQFGAVTIDRPCAQAVWAPTLAAAAWQQADASFTRDGGNAWSFRGKLAETWQMRLNGLLFELRFTDFGHVGTFPEHIRAWRWLGELRDRLDVEAVRQTRILNLFAYSGGATLSAARLGFPVCHLDASRKMVAWGARNAEINGLQEAPIRWIVDDVKKFLSREIRRGAAYEGIILDPPSFGRGKRQELFQIDHDMVELLALCRRVLAATPRFVLLSCHTPGYTPLVLQHLLRQSLDGLTGQTETGEMVLEGGNGVLPTPSGAYAIWSTR